MLFGILIFGLTIVGSMRLLNYDKLSAELFLLREKKNVLDGLLNDLEHYQLIDSSSTYAKFIDEYYNKYKLEYPSEMPVDGFVTRGMNQSHFGIYIAAKYLENIYSSGFGRVIFSGMNKDLGNTIIISHPAGFITVYAHNDTNLVISGEVVKKGQIIARIGETGNSKGPHLHFEIWKNNQVLDPRDIILKYKEKDVSIR